jgi:hypothetical protein
MNPHGLHPSSSSPLTNTLAPGHQASKLIRHGLAMLGGYLATQGFTGDVNRPSDLALAALLFLSATIWSWLSRATVVRRLSASLSPEQRRELEGRGRLILEVLAGQLIAALAGVLQANGESTEALAVAGLNYVLSSIHRPGAAKGAGKDRDPVMLMKAAALVLLPVMLVSCMAASGNDQTGEWKLMAAGLDAESLKTTSKGFDGQKVNMSTSFKATLKTVEKLWNAYLTLKGFEFISGRYYDHLGKEVDAATSVKLTELKNANSVEMANLKIKEMEAMHALAPAAPVAP